MANDGTLKFDTSIDAKGFSDGLSKLGNIASTGIKATTAVLGAAATAVTAVGAASIKVGSEFQSSMSQVAATMGITAQTIAEDGTKPFEILQEAAKQAGESTQFSASEAAEALNYLALAGYDAGTAAEVLPSVLNLAAAGGLDLAYASDLATDAMSALGIAASNENLTSFGDQMAVTAQKSNTSVAQLGEAILTVGATAKNLAGGTTELNTALGILADSGIKGAEGGTHLRNVLLSLQSPTDDAAAALEQYTKGVYDAKGNMRPLNDILGELNTSLADMTQQEKTQVINSIFNKTDLAAAQVLLAGCASSVDELGTVFATAEIDVSKFGTSIDEMAKSFDTSISQEEYAAQAMEKYGVTAEQAGVMYSGFMGVLSESGTRFDELSGYIAGSDGAMQDMANTMNDNLQGDIKILQSALEGLGISLYEGLDGPMREITQTATEMVGQLSDAFKEGGFDGLVTAAGDVLTQVVQKVSDAAPTLINAAVGLVQGFADGLLANQDAITESGITLITSLVSGLASTTSTLWTTAIELGASFISGIADSIPEMVKVATDAIQNILDQLQEYDVVILQAGIDIVLGLAEGIANAIPELLNTASVMIGELLEKVANELPRIVQAIVDLIPIIIDALVSAVPELLNGAVTFLMAIIDAIPIIIDSLLSALPEIITSIVDFIVNSVDQIVPAAITLLMGIIDAIPDIITAIVDNLPMIITAIVGGLVGAVPQIVDAAIVLLLGIIDAIPDIVVAIVENLPTIIGAIVEGLVMALPQVIVAAVKLLWGIIKAIPQIVVGLAKAIPEIIVGIVKGLGNGIVSIGQAAMNIGSAIIDGIVGFFGGDNTPSGVIEDAFDGTVEFLTSIGDDIAEAVGSIPEMVSGFIDDTVEWFATLPDRIGEWLTNTVTSISEWGTELFTTAGEIASSTIDNVVTFISELPEKIAYWLGYAIGSFIQFGINLVSWVTTEVPKIIENIVTFFSELPSKIWTWLVNVVTNMIQFGVNLLATATTVVTDTINAIVTFFSELPSKIWTWLVNTVNNIVQFGTNLYSAASTAVMDAVSEMVRIISELPTKIWTWLVNVVTKVQQFGINLKNKAVEAAQKMVTGMIDTIKGLPDKFKEIGSNIVSGIWNGISSGWDWLKDKVAGLADSLLQGAKDALGIHSPSTRFRDELGKWILPGVDEGVEDTLPEAQKTISGAADVLVNTMKDEVARGKRGSVAGITTRATHESISNSKGGDTYVDEHFEQTNTYNCPTATPSEVNKSQREAARKLLGGVK